MKRRHLLKAALALPIAGCHRAVGPDSGAVAARTDYKVGDRYVYQAKDYYSKVVLETLTQTVSQVTDLRVIYNDGKFVTDRYGNILEHWDGRRFGPNQVYPAQFSVGQVWKSAYRIETPTRNAGSLRMEFSIPRRERITVPAGTFDAFRVDGRGFLVFDYTGQVEMTHWCAPERLRRPVAWQWVQYIGRTVGRAEREELVSLGKLTLSARARGCRTRCSDRR